MQLNSPDVDYCTQILSKVSRTFAPTIRMLPKRLYLPVTVAYLLCRIARPANLYHWRNRLFRLLVVGKFHMGCRAARVGHSGFCFDPFTRCIPPESSAPGWTSIRYSCTGGYPQLRISRRQILARDPRCNRIQRKTQC